MLVGFPIKEFKINELDENGNIIRYNEDGEIETNEEESNNSNLLDIIETKEEKEEE